MMNIKNNKMTSSRKGLVALALTGLALTFSQTEVWSQDVKKNAKAGVGVYEIAINPVDNYIYVSGIGTRQAPNGGIMKIDPKSLKIVDSIMITENQPFGIALNAKTQTIYTSNTTGNSVSAIDIKSKKLIATISGNDEKSHTREIIIDEDKNLIYVSNVDDNSNIWVIDGASNKFLYDIPNLGKNVTGMAFSPNKEKIYITILGDNKVGVVDVASRTLESSFESGGEGPINIVTDKNGERLFVTNRKSNNVTVLSTSGELLKVIPTGGGAIGIAYDAKTNRIFSANRDSGTTTIINASNYKIIKDVATGTHPNNVKVAADGSIFVLNKAKSGKRGDNTPPPADPNGDTITLIK